MPVYEAFGDDEAVATRLEDAPQLACSCRDIGGSARVLERRQREDDVKRFVREGQLTRIHPAHVEVLAPVLERRVRRRVVEHRTASLAAGEVALAVDVRRD